MANYLEYSKTILTKMSFCPQLLNKEYKKAVAKLSALDAKRLNHWIQTQKFASKIRFISRVV